MQYRTVVRPVEDMGTLKVVNIGFYSFIRTLCTNINPVRELSHVAELVVHTCVLVLIKGKGKIAHVPKHHEGIPKSRE
jgi:hypothetical protein